MRTWTMRAALRGCLGTLTFLFVTCLPGLAAAPSGLPACGTVTAAQIVQGSGLSVPAPSLRNVVIVPETLGGNDVTEVALTFAADQQATPNADVTASGNTATVALNAFTGKPGAPIAAARVVSVTGPACTRAPVLVARLGSGLAGLALSSDQKTISVTIAQDVGQVSLAVQRDTIWPVAVAYDSSADATAYRLEAATKITMAGDAAHTLTFVPNSTTMQLLQGTTPLVAGIWTPAPGAAFEVSPCKFLDGVDSAISVKPIQATLGGTVVSLTNSTLSVRGHLRLRRSASPGH